MPWGAPDPIERAHDVICRYDQDRLRERWFGSDEGLIHFAWEAVKTKDEKSGQLLALPDEEYLVDHLHNCVRERMYLVLKSRQIIITWTTYIYLLWACLRARYCVVGLIPEKGEKGAEHIDDRIELTLWPAMPYWLRKDYDRGEVKGLFHLKRRRGLDWQSKIRFYSQGPHQARGNVHTVLFWDEMAFYENARKAFTGAMPTITKRKDESEGSALFVSTLGPGSWHDSLMGGPEFVDPAVRVAFGEQKPDVDDRAWLPVPADEYGREKRRPRILSPLPGVAHYANPQYGAFCAVYAFTADSAKRDPQWEKSASVRVGGPQSPEWLLEYRMRRDAYKGTLVFPNFDVRVNVVPQRPVNRECEIFLSADWGHTAPTAILFNEWNPWRQTLTVFDEIYIPLSVMPVDGVKSLIRQKLAQHLQLSEEEMNLEQILGDNVGDPEGAGYMAQFMTHPNGVVFRGNPPRSEGGQSWRINTPKTLGEARLNGAMRPQFVCCGVRQYADGSEGVCQVQKVGDTIGTCGRKNAAGPAFLIMEDRAPNLVHELPLQQRKDPTEAGLMTPEKSKSFPNHAVDAALYATMRYPEWLSGAEAPAPRGDYQSKEMSKLTTVESFWRQYHDDFQAAAAHQKAIDEAGQVAYPSDNWGFDE